MGVKRGRPFKEESMGSRFTFRLKPDDSEKLDSLVNRTGMNRSDVIRKALEKLFKEKDGNK